jgi:hypothetical protein
MPVSQSTSFFFTQQLSQHTLAQWNLLRYLLATLRLVLLIKLTCLKFFIDNPNLGNVDSLEDHRSMFVRLPLHKKKKAD